MKRTNLIEKWREIVKEVGEEGFYRLAGKFEREVEEAGVKIGSLEHITITERVLEVLD